jgi:hypothetical protein
LEEDLEEKERVMLVGVASGDWMSPNRTSENVERWGGSGWARVGQYLSHLPFKVVVGHLAWKRTNFVVTDMKGVEYHPDILILQRLMHNGLSDHIRQGIAAGQTIINDLDDWYWGLDPSNNAFKYSHPKFNDKENINHYKSVLNASSIVTVSTSYLADRASRFIRNPMVLIKNTVDVDNFSVKQHTDSDVPVVGWAGSTAHRSGDLETVGSILKGLYKEGFIKLMHLGHHTGATSFASRIGLPDSEVHTLPLCSAEEYRNALTMDIGIVPLRVTPFNQAKSDIKGLEYAAAGLPFVAQSIDSYNELFATGIGRTARRPYNWVKHLKALCDPEVRKEEGARNRELVRSRDISVGIQQWTQLLESF